ncbi:MAG TPA: ABC transporter permease [Trebonia sp.]|nr:ABC transporter permease [Trebonia sp.]
MGSMASLAKRAVNLPGILTGVGLLAVWQILVSTHSLNFKFLESPWGIITNLGNLFTGTGLWGNLGYTLGTTLAGWAIASVAGFVVGSLIGLADGVWKWTAASLEALRSVPVIAMLPIGVVIFGLTSKMELVLVIYVAFWPVLINTIAGVRAVHPLLREVSKSLHLTRSQELRRVILPAAMPQALVGVRLSISLSLVLAVVAEIAANPAGLGFQLDSESQALQPALMFGVLFVLGVLGIALNAGLTFAVRFISPGIAQHARVGRS